MPPLEHGLAMLASQVGDDEQGSNQARRGADRICLFPIGGGVFAGGLGRGPGPGGCSTGCRAARDSSARSRPAARRSARLPAGGDGEAPDGSDLVRPLQSRRETLGRISIPTEGRPIRRRTAPTPAIGGSRTIWSAIATILQPGQAACFALFHQKDQLSFYIPGINGEWFLNAYTTERRPGNPDRMPVEGQACVGV